MRRLGILAVCLAGVVAFAACGGGDDGSTEEFLGNFLEHGDTDVAYKSLDGVVTAADLVVRGRIVDVKLEEKLPNDRDPLVSSFIVEIDEVLAGELAMGDAEAGFIRVAALPNAGLTADEIRDSIPKGGIDGVHFLFRGTQLSGPPDPRFRYFYLNTATLVFRGSNDEATGFDGPEAGMRYFGGKPIPFDEAVLLAEDAAKRARNFGILFTIYRGQWLHESGRVGPLGIVNVLRGAEHCDLQDWLVVSFRTEEYGHVWFARVPPGSESPRHPIDNVEIDATIPEDVPDSGYGRGDARLFVAPDLSAAWVTFDGETERWPRQDPPLICS